MSVIATQKTEEEWLVYLSQPFVALDPIPEEERTEAIYITAIARNALAFYGIPPAKRTPRIWEAFSNHPLTKQLGLISRGGKDVCFS